MATDGEIKGNKPHWNTEGEFCRQVFLAAIQGICSNPNFFGPEFQQSPQAAVDFADSVVIAAIYR